MNKLDPRVDATGTKHKDETTHAAGADTVGKPHHKGPAALGGPIVGATTHEAVADNHGLGHNHSTDLHTGADANPLGAGHQGTTSTTHHERDAALGAGAAGAAGVAAHEHNKSSTHGTTHDSTTHATTGTHGATPLVEKPLGTDIGDKLHGVERNRGPVGGATSTVGDAGHHIGGSHTSSHVGHGHTTGAGEHDSHKGRDAAVLGGAAYAGQQHEQSKHHIGGETSSHVGHGHSSHGHQEGLTGASATSGLGHQEGTTGLGHKDGLTGGSGLTGNNESTNLPGTNTTGTTGDNAAFDSEARRGTTSGLHTDPALHHVPAVGKSHQN